MSTDYRVGEWLVRPQRGSIERGDEVVRIKPKSMAVLACLAQAGNAVLTRDDLFESVWPGQVVSDATLTQCIVELRRAFGDSAQEAQVIQTIPKVGFCLIPEVESLSADSEAVGDGGDIDAPSRKSHWHRWAASISIILGALVIVVGIRWYQQNPAPGSAAPSATDASQPSIAVLPFENISEESGNEYFADGLSEELRDLLAKVPQLQVSARTSSNAFRDKDVTVSEIANALGVTNVLEGSVRKAGDHIRISVQLIEASSGFELWSESYDRTLGDLFAVQDDIAEAVVKALRIKLIGAWPHQEKVDPDVYALFLQAQHFAIQATPEGDSGAVEKLQEALKLDPDYATALAYLAGIYLYQSNNLVRDFDEGFELGRNTATEALAIDPRLSGAWAVLAYIQAYYDWDWRAAGRSVERALESEPLNAYVLHGAGAYYQMLGRFEDSLKLRKHAIRLDPLNPYFRESETYTLLSLGQFDEAQSTLESLLETHPQYRRAQLLQAKMLLLRGDARGALDVLQTAPADRNLDRAFRALALGGVGRAAEARTVLNSMASGPSDGAPYYRALYHAWAGERELAWEELEQAVGDRYRVLSYVLSEPMFYTLHDDPRWRNLLERIGLLEYWLKVPAKYGGPAEQSGSE